MEDWKTTLRNRIEGMLTSKRMIDYDSVVAKFESAYNELTQDIAQRDKSLFWTRKNKETATTYFYIHHYALGLVKQGENIEVILRNEEPHPETKEKIAEIRFENDFAYIVFTHETVSHYLNNHYIDQLFKNAYRHLL
ncbi:hypothetical protein L8956_04100 [Peribacillus frigoritolerans]|uniref:hypothetical protein n=1 Tax=Peribacillus frigoritolerans TaxID=450367 RepID=UPI001EFE3EDF|nr:hypothetical protein [Peribacillus frigoritolerans]ULM97920.1 hypothetical protein L8956_04100 [Peribacillus frigoritolerans]